MNLYDELERVAVGFSCFRIRMIAQPVLEFQITDVLDQHDRVRARCLEQPGNWKTRLKQQISCLDVSAWIVGKRETSRRVRGLSARQEIDRTLVLIKGRRIERDYHARPAGFAAKI